MGLCDVCGVPEVVQYSRLSLALALAFSSLSIADRSLGTVWFRNIYEEKAMKCAWSTGPPVADILICTGESAPPSAAFEATLHSSSKSLEP